MLKKLFPFPFHSIFFQILFRFFSIVINRIQFPPIIIPIVYTINSFHGNIFLLVMKVLGRDSQSDTNNSWVYEVIICVTSTYLSVASFVDKLRRTHSIDMIQIYKYGKSFPSPFVSIPLTFILIICCLFTSFLLVFSWEG